MEFTSVFNLTEERIARFWSYVARLPEQDQCWVWTKSRGPKGYGMFRLSDDKRANAHRLAYFLHYGPITPGMLICHKCNYPPCCNPNHLYEGTRKDNAADARRAGRATLPVALYEERRKRQVEIRQLKSTGIKRKAVAAKFGISTSTVSRAWRSL